MTVEIPVELLQVTRSFSVLETGGMFKAVTAPQLDGAGVSQFSPSAHSSCQTSKYIHINHLR